MAIKFNVEPYYDDFETATAVDGLSPKEKYNKILFRPGHAVQARELTQLQSMLQNQVTQMGNHFFEEGAMVIPGHITLDGKAEYVKIEDLTAADINDLIGKTFVGSSTGLNAKVVAVVAATGSDPDTVYVKYQNSGTSQEKVFDDGETITADSFTATVQTNGTGYGAVAFIDNGIYFIEGNFVVVQSDQLVVEKYDTSPSYDIGLEVTESIQTSAGDASLNDNANGTFNYAAPGAHRYQIKTKLTKQAVQGTTLDKFLLLIRVEDGVVTQKVRATDYSIIEETLARRTFDESGNYTVRPFRINVREHTEVNTPGDEAKLAVGLEPAKAYVRGYEIETLATRYVSVDKARESTLFEGASVPMTVGNYIEVNNVEGIPDISTFAKMELRDSTGGTGTIIGYARARSYVYAGSNTYRLYLFDIQMNSSSVFDDVRSVKLASTPEYIADIVLSGGKAVIYEPTRNSMVFPLPFSRVKTCDSSADGDPDDFNYVYFMNRDVGTSNVAGGQATFDTVGVNELFEPFDDENWIMTVASGANNGDIVTLASGNVNIQSGSESVIISGLGSFEGEDVRLIAGVKRTLNHKAKSLTTSGAPNVDLYPVSTPTDYIRLGHADGYQLKAVYMSANTSTAATTSDTDVTEYYDFDDGQRDNFYDLAGIRRKKNTAFQPNGQLLVEYEYFTHTGSGDFFTVDSYDNLVDSDGAAVTYEDIPSFQSKNTGQQIELRSAVDFRPRIDDSGGNFSGTGSSTTTCPEPLTTFTTDIQYFLNRYDKVYLDKNGKFGITKGVPALEPELPEDPKDSMVLYNLYIPAYTLGPEEVSSEMIDNKRYTMRDIGKLERRINRIEYYTSLSLLEKEAADKQILDPNTQTQRLKSGFLTDSFASHNVGNVTSPEYRAAIDRERRQLRPLFSEDNVRLRYNNALSSGVQKTGDLVTLPYNNVEYVFQSQASSFINVNPFDVFKWTGTVDLSPSSDEWKDTSRRPNVVIDQEGVFDAMLDIIDETDAVGTVWNEWQTNWSGVVSRNTDTETRGRRTTTTTTTVTNTGQSRRGIQTSVVPETITTDIGDRVVEVNFAPFIRSRKIFFRATRLKPNTQVYAFFDGVAVADFVREEAFQAFADNENNVVNGANNVAAHPDGATVLTTDAQGVVEGSFFIPNNGSQRFQTGSRIFRLADSATNSSLDTTTDAEVSYNAQGLIETKENVTISTRVPRLESREITDNRIVRNTLVDRRVRWEPDNDDGGGWGDPLAQSFMIDTPGGAFITSLDLFFHTKDQNIPVTVQIREMNQGLPTQTILPFGEVTVNAADVNVVDLDVALPSPNESTTFTFPSPVYLQENTEYCFVVMANTNEYQVWYAEIGQDNYITGERISKQPYAGVMFLSQNASTWSPDQNKDMKFKLNRAEFTTGSTGQIILENGSVQERQLIKNPFRTTSGSNVVRVFHKNNHFFENTNNIASFVTIAGSTSVNGIPASEINGTHEVSSIEMDSYEITVTTNATGSGIDGGTSVTATENQTINTFYPFVQQITFPGTNSTWGVRLTSGMSLGATSPTPYVTDSTFSPVIVNQNFTVDKPKVIASDDNEQSGRTFFLRGVLSTNFDNISPVIDLDRASVFTVANRIDNPAAAPAGAGFNEVEDYVAETSEGSAQAKYVTKTVILSEASDGLRVFLDINRPSQTFVDVYYKATNTEEEIEDTDWTLANPNEPVPFSDDAVSFNESEYVIDPTNLFSVFALKIVMRSRNSSRVPSVRDLRVISLLP